MAECVTPSRIREQKVLVIAAEKVLAEGWSSYEERGMRDAYASYLLDKPYNRRIKGYEQFKREQELKA